MSELKELIKYIDLLEAEPFTGWTGGNKKGYLTACTSIKKKAEKLLQEQANAVQTSDSGLHLQRVTHRFITSIAEQYDIEPSKIVIGSQYGALVVQKYDEGASDKWETLALIDPNGG